jgi:2-alkenal reductase
MKRGTKPTLGIILIGVVLGATFLGAVVGGMVGFGLAYSRLDTPTQAVAAQPVAGSSSESTSPAELAAAAISAIQPSAGEAVTVNAVQQAVPAVVTVAAITNMGPSSGSGFFISADGYLVTNNHVVQGSQEIQVIYAKGGQVPARLVGASPEFDLAVLKVDGPVPGHVEWGDSGNLLLGSQVIAIGSALGEYRNTVTAGILSGFNRQVGNMGSLLQTDAAINQGNSGGPLINSNGQVIGVNTLVVRGDFADAEGLGFAIPSDIARSVVRNLIETGDARHPFLGIQYQAMNPQLANELGLSVTEGALLDAVLDGSPAARANLRPGDVIISLNGETVNDRNSLVSLLLEHVAGETITLEVLREGQVVTTQLTLGERA